MAGEKPRKAQGANSTRIRGAEGAKSAAAPKKSKPPLSAEEKAQRYQEWKQREYVRRKAVRAAARLAQGLEPIIKRSKAHMSEEERRAYEKEQKRLQAIRYRERLKSDPERMEKKRQRDQRGYQARREKNTLRQRKWAAENPERAREHYKKWAEQNQEKIKEKQRKHKEMRRSDPEYRAKEAEAARAYRARKRAERLAKSGLSNSCVEHTSRVA